MSADTLTFLHDEVRNSLIAEMPAEEPAAAAEQMEVIDLAYIMEHLPEPVRQTLETAGRLMSTDFISVRSDVSLGVVKRYLHLHEDLPDYTDGLMVADRDGVYQGKLLLNKVLTGDDETLVKDATSSQHTPIPATASEHDIALFFEQSHLVSAVVVDEDNRLLGRISLDYVIAILKAEADHALLGRAGLNEEADLFAPVINSARHRTVWLAINLVTAFLAAWVIGLYADTLEKIVALAVLMPIVASRPASPFRYSCSACASIRPCPAQ
ncbi:CBS domain-containing protein [Methylomonas sp. MgM2]